MNGLAMNTDLRFLISKEIQAIRIGRHAATLCFDGGGTIEVSDDIAHYSDIGEIDAVFKTSVAAAGMLVQLVNSKIVNAEVMPSGSLLLRFSNGQAIELRETTTAYESYVITFPEARIVV